MQKQSRNPLAALRRDMGKSRHSPRLQILGRAARLLPPNTFSSLRARLYRMAGVQIAPGAAILGALELLGDGDIAPRLQIAEGVVVSPRVTLGLDADIVLEKNVALGPGVSLYTATHAIGFGSRRMNLKVTAKPIRIEEGAWVGLQSIVLAGVTIGRGSVVSAGSVVTQDVPPNTLVVGNPAVVVQNLPFGNR